MVNQPTAITPSFTVGSARYSDSERWRSETNIRYRSCVSRTVGLQV
ncbi:hypothetical protein BDE02_02G187300 [Populus trichocarpa]|nr:hypothetical protein BDE02_02G187300 [Populus trichocarpa]